MSVQLILYPQNYNGTYNEISSSSTEFIVNGLNFNGLNTTPTYTSSTTGSTFLDVLTSAPPIITNSWYRFRTDATGTPAYPTSSVGNLILDSVTTLTLAGVYQKLSNLVVGQQYTITINIGTTGTGTLLTQLANGVSFSPTGIHSASSSLITTTFTAVSTTDTIMVVYYNNVVDSISISDISVQPIVGAVPSGATNFLDNGQVICDLYEDEDLPLTLSVDDFKNVAEKVQSYSKAFNLPATKRNNRIFDQVFEITRVNDGIIFNPYKRTQCVLKQDGFILFKGFLRLLDVTDKEGEISYNVNLYSEVVALADTLKDRAFRDLDFTELEHEYNYSNIRNTWVNNNIFTNPSTSGFRSTNTVKYPFVDWNHQFTFTNSGMPKLPNLESAFRPFINIKYLINRIFQDSEFTFESTFFDTTDFGKLYIDFNWGSAETPTITNVTNYNAQWAKQIYGVTNPSVDAGTSFTNLVLFDTSNSTVPPNYDLSSNIITATSDGEQYSITGAYRIENTSAGATQTVDCQWIHNSLVVAQDTLTISPSSFQDFNFTFNVILASGDTLQAQFKRSNPSSSSTVRMFESGITPTSNVFFNVNTLAITTDVLLQTLRGELGQWEFLKGLITMFNLVTLVDEDNPNNIIIEPYSDVFIPTSTAGTTLANRGIQYDWTDKIDVSEMKLTPLTDLNKKTIFKFVEDDDDYSFNQYKNFVGGHLYGSYISNAGNEFNILDGEEEVIAEPFAATVVKPLMSQFADFITPAIYAMSEDDTSEGFENSPRIMYNNEKVTMTNTTYSVPAQNGVGGDAFEDEFLQFSHLSDVPTITGSRDFHFGECQLMPGVGAATPNNLFNLYWLPYYSELYNPNTRTMIIKVNLSPADINTFKFNDTVFIKNRVFRVNKIDYKPNDLATVEFILIP